MELKVGSVIVSHDFEAHAGRTPCFKIGEVIELTERTIVFKVLVDVWDGKVYIQSAVLGTEMTCPVPGYSYAWDWDGRIQILS